MKHPATDAKAGLYVITCLPCGKHYIGESADVRRRWNAHRSHLRRGVHENRILQEDFLQYGESSFQFQFLLFGSGSDKNTRQDFETCILATLAPSQRYNAYTNWRKRGQHGNPFLGHHHTLHARQAQRDAHLGRPSPFQGRTQSEAVRAHIREENRGKPDRRKPLRIHDVRYDSVSHASTVTGLARRLLRARCHSDEPRFAAYVWCGDQISFGQEGS